MIGAAAVLLLYTTGRLAGVSGILSGIPFTRGTEQGWRAAFVTGLVLAGAVWQGIRGQPLPIELEVRGWPLWVAGLLVGFGSRMGNGCTSGHGVCGIARFSRRSLLATLTFIAAGMLTVWIGTL